MTYLNEETNRHYLASFQIRLLKSIVVSCEIICVSSTEFEIIVIPKLIYSC